jgi:hypothetical protein
MYLFIYIYIYTLHYIYIYVCIHIIPWCCYITMFSMMFMLTTTPGQLRGPPARWPWRLCPQCSPLQRRHRRHRGAHGSGHGGAGGEQPQCQSRTPFSVALGDFLEKRRNLWVSSWFNRQKLGLTHKKDGVWSSKVGFEYVWMCFNHTHKVCNIV